MCFLSTVATIRRRSEIDGITLSSSRLNYDMLDRVHFERAACVCACHTTDTPWSSWELLFDIHVVIPEEHLREIISKASRCHYLSSRMSHEEQCEMSRVVPSHSGIETSGDKRLLALTLIPISGWRRHGFKGVPLHATFTIQLKISLIL